MPRLVTAYPRRSIFATAWSLARRGARHFGGRASQYFPAALKQAWAEARDMVATVAAQRARVLAEVERIRFEASELGVAIRRRAEAELEAQLQAHRIEMRARAVAYKAKWGTGAAVPAARAAA